MLIKLIVIILHLIFADFEPYLTKNNDRGPKSPKNATIEISIERPWKNGTIEQKRPTIESTINRIVDY